MSKEVLKGLRKFAPHLFKAQEDNLNEADTLLRIMKVFEAVLGYDGLSEISREMQVRNRYVDLAIKVDGVTKLLVEAKAAGTELRERHIDQARFYASDGNIRWVVLTNGVVWTLFHLTFEEGIEYIRAFSVDLKTQALEECAEKLALLERTCVARGGLEEYWSHRIALSPASIGRALFTSDALAVIRREIRRQEEILIDPEDLAVALHEMMSTEAREQIGPLKIRRRQRARTRDTTDAEITCASAGDVRPTASIDPGDSSTVAPAASPDGASALPPSERPISTAN